MKCQIFLSAVLFFLLSCNPRQEGPSIDRKVVFDRHIVRITEADTLGSLTLGNGRFAMTMDITGLQTFPEAYQHGVALGTQSEWGWHSFPSDKDYRIEQALKPLKTHGREIPYARQWPKGSEEWKAANYLRQNPHRIHLANVGWYIRKEDGQEIALNDLKAISQELDMWKGELNSHFEIEGKMVDVTSLVDQKGDRLVVRVKSSMILEGKLGLKVKFPFPTDNFLDEAAHYSPEEAQRLSLSTNDSTHYVIRRQLDNTKYFVGLSSNREINSVATEDQGYIFSPDTTKDTWSLQLEIGSTAPPSHSFDFEKAQKAIHADYRAYWNQGAMIDFGGVEDARAEELERRMVLSLYLTHANCGGQTPPQETGLTFNSWYGKPHLEMAWWHGVHFPLWGHEEVLEGHLDFYIRNQKIAKEIADRQGFEGVRWQKMTDPWGGETASSVGSYLIWQQPHPIYFSELIFRANPETQDEVLKTYGEIVEETAAFMADFAWFDSSLGYYILPGVIPAQERFDPAITFNPAYELAYWRWGLEKAQQWLERQGKARNEKWDRVLAGLAPLPEKDGLYLATESSPDSYSNPRFMTDHPSVLGTYGMLPATRGLDKGVMKNTFEKIWSDWQWEDTWGWDFPMTAMTASRLGMPEKAVDALLMPIQTNTYLKNGHNYQDDRLRIYLPGNGGLLIALAMMAAGTDEEREASGFPNGWNVRHEGFRPMP